MFFANHKILNLIKYIVCYASEHGSKLTTVRLVKFIYLADVYHAKYFEGKTITDFPWAFVNFGPYCGEVMAGIDAASREGVIARNTYESSFSDKNYALFSCKEESDKYKRDIPIAVLAELQESIKKYGDDTASLLDYVYFDTEPMDNVKKGDLLDFSKVKPFQPIQQIKSRILPKNKMDKINDHLNRLVKKMDEGRGRIIVDDRNTEKWKDEIYYNALSSLNEDELPDSFQGIAEIKI